MSKKDSYKIVVNGRGYDVVEHQVMQPCFMFRTTKDEVWFFPWAAISSVKTDAKMMKIIERKQREAAEEAQSAVKAQVEKPPLTVPSKGLILPFSPNERRPS